MKEFLSVFKGGIRFALVSLFFMTLSASVSILFTQLLFPTEVTDLIPLDAAIFLAGTGGACVWGMIVFLTYWDDK